MSPSISFRTAELVSGGNISHFAWAGLRSFQNVRHVASVLHETHNSSRDDASNVKKQAEQIRDCLIQAREYSDAAQTVSLATRPVLAYYSVMMLAIAEILFKQSGDSSLDRARQQHRHHGLMMSVPGRSDDKYSTGSTLIAKPAFDKNGNRHGTFELWHRTARHVPLCGMHEERLDFRSTMTGYRGILLPPDARLPELPSSGISFRDVVRALPLMSSFLRSESIPPEFATVEVRSGLDRASKRGNVRFTVQHTPDSRVLDRVLNSIEIEPRGIEFVEVTDYGTGARIEWETGTDFDFSIGIPFGATITSELDIVWPSGASLNEFGYLYVGLFLAGNYARYYPDFWMRDVEDARPLALGIEELLHHAATRAPLLTLSNLRRTYLVPTT